MFGSRTCSVVFLTCSHVWRGRYEDAVASSTVPRGFGVLAGRCFDLQSADFLCFIIRKLRFACVVCFAFFHEEYRIALVDFIIALRRTKGRGRRTLRSPPSPSSGLHLIHPGVSAAAGKCWLPRAYRDIGFRYPVQVAHRQFRMLCSYLCSGYDRSRFSRVVGRVSFVFHYWGGEVVRACGYLWFCYGL